MAKPGALERGHVKAKLVRELAKGERSTTQLAADFDVSRPGGAPVSHYELAVEPEPQRMECACGRRLPCRHCELIDYMNPPRRRPTTAGDLILLGAMLGLLALFGWLASMLWVAL